MVSSEEENHIGYYRPIDIAPKVQAHQAEGQIQEEPSANASEVQNTATTEQEQGSAEQNHSAEEAPSGSEK
jgi:hypothetical protein